MRRLFFAPVLLAALGCSAGALEDDGAPSGSGGAASDSGGTGGNAPGGSGGTGPALPTGSGLTREDVRQTCDASTIGPRLLRRLTRGELDATLHDLFPEIASVWDGVRLSPDLKSKLGFTTDANSLVASAPVVKSLLETAEDVAEAIVSAEVLPTVLPCAAQADATCAAQFIQNYGNKLFRRPLTGEETSRYQDYYQSVAGRSSFSTGLKWTLVGLIQSPHAFYRSEIGASSADGYQLTQDEIATNLAYTFTGSAPDRTLLDKAAAGQLQGAAALRAEAERLVATPRGKEALAGFFLEWLEYKKVLGQSRADASNFATDISPLMVRETTEFVTAVLEQGGGVTELMTANFTSVNATLAQFYGLSGASSDAFVTVPRQQGVGILAQGSLLAATAHQTATSPTLRGLLFQQSFLCANRTPPPDIVPPIETTAPTDQSITTRQKYEEHHGKGACGACHAAFEPFGYTFEHFDETGRYRADEHGLAIDTAATALMPDSSTREFSSLDDLARLVDETDDVENCISGLMAAYFLSGGGGEACLAEDQRAALAAGDLGLREYVLSLAETAHFSRRK